MKKVLLPVVLCIVFSHSLYAINIPETGQAVAITNAAGEQRFPDVAYNSTDNTFLVVWEAVSEEDIRTDIHGVLVEGDTAQTIGDPFVIIQDFSDVFSPEVVYNPVDNEFLVVARFEAQALALAQRVSANGERIGDTIDIGPSNGPNFDPAARARVVAVAHNAVDNQYFIALGGPPSGQIVNSDLSLDIIVDGFGIGDAPTVAWSSESNVYLVAWEDRETRSTGSENLSAQLISNTGELLGDNIRLRDQEFAEESPRVAYDTQADQFLVVWDERIGFAEGNDTLTDTIGQIVAADGTLVGDPIPIEQGTAYTLRQDVAYNPEWFSDYLVVWKGDESGEFAFADIFGRFVSTGGGFLTDIFPIFDGGDDATDDGTSERYFDESKLPAVAANTTSGGFLVVWEEGGTNRNPLDRDIMAAMVYMAVNEVSDWSIMN